MKRFGAVVAGTGVFLGAMFVGPPGSTPPAAAAGDVKVHPVPDHAEVVGSPLLLAGPVQLVTTANADRAATNELRRVLDEAGVDTSGGDRPGRHSVKVTLGAVGDAAVDAGIAAAGLEVSADAESYALAVDNDPVAPSIVIAGSDGAGQYYGVQTLRQLVTTDRGRTTVATVEVVDRPAMPMRGTIEGFYGAPWSHADRLRHLGFLSRQKMNTYVYAPKDDPYHRERWRDPYPEAKLAELAELVTAATTRHVNFWFAISPGVSVCYSDDADFAALVGKASELWNVGVRSFAILLDDIDSALRCAADRERFGADPSPAAAAQAHLLNRFRTEFLQPRAGAARLMTVPTEYGQPSGSTPYTQRFAELVAPEVLVMWTGTSPFGPTTGSDVRAARQTFGHDVVMWDNYPVNDFASNRLFLGPLRGRGADVGTAGMTGYVSNPMNQAAASEIPLFTSADFAWNPQAYDPETSWDAALRSVGGRGYDAVRTLAENSKSWYLDRDESPRLMAAIDRFSKAFGTGSRLDGPATELRSRLAELTALPAELAEVPDASLVRDLSAHAGALAQRAQVADAAVKMVQDQEAGDGESAWRARRSVIEARAAARALPQEIPSVWTAIGKPGRQFLDEFVGRTLDSSTRWLGLADARETTATPTRTWGFEQDGESEGWSAGNNVGPVTVSGGALHTQVAGADPYLVHAAPLAIAPACRGGHTVEVVMTAERGGRGQIYWATTDRPGLSEDQMTAFDVTAGGPSTYRIALDTGTSVLTEVRLDLPENGGQVAIDAIRVLVNQPSPSGVVSGGPAAAVGSSLAAAADACLATDYVSAVVPEAGEALVVELPRRRPVKAVLVLQSPDAPATASVRVRSDGTWRTVGSIDSGYGEMAVGGPADAIALHWAATPFAPAVAEVVPLYSDEPPVDLAVTLPGGETVDAGTSAAVKVSITPTGLTAVSGTLELAGPVGWRVTPSSTQVEIPRGREAVVDAAVEVPADLPAGRYELAATFTPTGGEPMTQHVSMQVVLPAGETNLARGGVASASSVELDLAQFSPDRAVDGDRGTRWSSASTDSEWLQVQLAAAARLAKVVLRWEAAYAARYRVQVSSDGVTWSDVAVVDQGDGDVDELRIDSVTEVKYVRMQGVARATAFGYSLYELEVYGVR